MLAERPVGVDHDGTLSWSQMELDVYSSMVIEYNASRLGMMHEAVERRLQAKKEAILSVPEIYGWELNGMIVAAATCDHYIFNQVATCEMLKDLVTESRQIKRLVEADGGINGYVDRMFTICSPKLGVYYRPEAKEFLTELHKLSKIVSWSLVTNSDPLVIVHKLKALNLDFEVPVVGGAKKYKVDRQWLDLLPSGPYRGFPGFPARGVELQRHIFYQKLVEKFGEEAVKRLVFVDDVGEFILWLDWLAHNNPEFHEAKTALIVTPGMTPPWEWKHFAQADGTHLAADNLLDILSWLQSFL